MPGLDPQAARLLRVMRRLRLRPVDELPVDRGRRLEAFGHAVLGEAARPVAQVTAHQAPGPDGAVPIRVYRPEHARPLMIVYCHGGGGVIGSVDSYDAITRRMAVETGCLVASVDYRLAPEHPHPAAIDDALAAWRWATAAAAELGVTALAIAGDSFGGYLAAHVVRHRAALRRPDLQLLIYPLLDLTHPHPSMRAHGEGRLLTRRMIEYFARQVGVADGDRVAASPGLDADLAGVPPTIVVTAGFDPLADDGRV
ncbi:MAG: alpha/beta hydrolase [Kofleriaceae bacterium]